MDYPEKSEKIQFKPLPDGPYLLVSESGDDDLLRNSKGEVIPAKTRTTLCRCGTSSNKPFCDGTHKKIGFSGEKEVDGSLDQRISYKGKAITIHDNRGICAHSGFCTDGLPLVFNMDREPWIDPDGAEAEEIIETIRKCPSGALGYSVDGIEHRDLDREPGITVSRNGPYRLVGWIEVEGEEPRAKEVSREHCAACRCGASKNKPFCDGSHWYLGFKDEDN